MIAKKNKKKINILVVDDHPLFRKGIVSMLEDCSDLTVVGEATNGHEALDKAIKLTPDLIIMDVMMPECDGLQATRNIIQKLPNAKILMLTVADDDNSVFEAVKWGAAGYLLKNLEPTDLVQMIRSVFQGEAPISPVLAKRILGEFANLARKDVQTSVMDNLSTREHEVLKLVSRGKKNIEIAEALTIAEHTVKNHLRNILEKLHVRNRVEAASLAIQDGILEN